MKERRGREGRRGREWRRGDGSRVECKGGGGQRKTRDRVEWRLQLRVKYSTVQTIERYSAEKNRVQCSATKCATSRVMVYFVVVVETSKKSRKG